MEDRRFIKVNAFVIAGGMLFAIPLLSFAYDDKTTHPALTQEIIRFWNHRFPEQKLPDDEMHLIMQGSIDEDNGTRWLQHFYDPIKNRGLTLGNEEEFAAIGVGIGVKTNEWMSSKEWARATQGQAGLKAFTAGILTPLFSFPSDYSWDRGVYDYAWGDKRKGLLTLGHILHLLEDATVPDHTRNDPHPPILDLGSPYEQWAKKFTPENLSLAAHLTFRQSATIFDNLDLDDYFNKVASYSNKNFFSKDTTPDKSNTYQDPILGKEYTERLSNGGLAKFVYDRGNTYRLALVKFDIIDNQFEYFIKDEDDLVLNDYWAQLSKQAILHGAGVVKLFFDEVEKEKRTKELYNKNRPWVAKIVDVAKERIFNLASALYGVTVPYDLTELETAGGPNATPLPVEAFPKPAPAPSPRPEPPGVPVVDSAPQTPPPPLVSQFQQQPQSVPPPAIAPPPPPPPQGRGGASTPNTPPSEPPFASPSSAPAAPPPAAEASSSPPADTTAPDISISVNQCAGSLASDGCLVATTTLNVSWSSTADDVDHYVVECLRGNALCAGFAYDPTATSTAFAADEANYVFRAKAVDGAGNESPFSSQAVEVNARPVVINEIAWAGTGPSNTADEWIELYNRSGKSIPLTGWILHSATDGKPYVNLTGAIPANGYYLIERTDDTTVSDVAADLTAPFGSGSGMGLGDGGEELILEFASTTMDATPAVGACGPGRWCGGSTFDRSTMERIDPDLPGSAPTSWGSNDSLIRNGTGADGGALRGTPKARNSRNYYISPTGVLETAKTLTKARSPYFVDANGVTINTGVVLTIEPGAVVKFAPSSAFPVMAVRGRIRAVGTAAEPIVFTSFLDDSHAGDTNGDATTTEPHAGNWGTVLATNTADSQLFEHVVLRYGGGLVSGFGPPPEGANSALSVISGNIAARRVTVEHSATNGITLLRSSGEVSDSIFRDNTGVHASGPYGLIVGGGATTIQGNRFEHNRNGLAVFDGPHEVSGNAFIGNIEQAASFGSSDPSGTPTFSANTASGNGTNGIAMSSIINDYVIRKDLPYVIGAFSIPAGKQVSVEPGTVLKMRHGFMPGVDGTLQLLGTANAPVVITSLHDDSYGGDTNGDGMCDPGNASSTAACPAPGDWHSIIVGPTSASTTFEHVIVRYGAACALCGGFPFAAIKVDGTSASITNAVFERNKAFGVWLANSASTTIASSVFREHRLTPGVLTSIGLLLDTSSVILDGVTFSDNDIGIGASGVSAVTVGSGGVIFNANTTDDLPADLIP